MTLLWLLLAAPNQDLPGALKSTVTGPVFMQTASLSDARGAASPA